MDRLPASAWLAAQAQGLVGVARKAAHPGRLQQQQQQLAARGPSAARNATEQQMLIDTLRLEASQSVRTSVIILAAFNAVAAFATAAGILYEAHLAAQRQQRQRLTPSTIRSRRSSRIRRFFVVPPAEIYPLALSCGITVQSIGFAAVQAQGLAGLMSTACAAIAQFMLPAVFLVPYIQLVFAVEGAVRGLHKARPFAARGRYATAGSLGVLGVLLLISLLVAHVARSPNVCFASLFWFVASYARGGFGVLLSIVLLLVLCTGLLVVRLTRGGGSGAETEAEAAERVAASRMVFYMALAILTNILLLPFFYVLGFQDKRRQTTGPALNVSMVAAVVANLSGLLTGGLRLFLRSSSMSTMGCAEPSSSNKATAGSWRMSRSRSNASRIRGPFPLPAKIEEAEQASAAPWTGSAQLPSPPPVAASPSRADPLPDEPELSLPRPPPKSRSSSSPPGPPRSLLFLPATTYTIPKFLKKASGGSGAGADADKGKDDELLLVPPPSMYSLAGGGGGGHRRDSSMVSSVTVQIGLRLSNVLADLVPMHARPDLLLDKKVYTLDDGPASLPAPLPAPLTIRRPSPLVATSTAAAAATNDALLDDDSSSSAYSSHDGASPTPTTATADDGAAAAAAVTVTASPPPHGRRNPVKEARMKTLPPVPRQPDQQPPQPADAASEANPFSDRSAVRQPGRSPLGAFPEAPRLLSPRGGLANTRLSRSNSAGAAVARTGPPAAALLRRENSWASYRGSASRSGSGSDWI